MNKRELYQLIAANDQGRELSAEFSAMSAETEVTQTLNGNDLRVWAALFEADYGILKAAAASSVKAEMTLQLVDDPGSTLTMPEPAIQGMLANLGLSAEAVAYLYAKASTPKYPGLTETKIQNARDQVAKGLI
jgi:hypothetical protein